jgi:hypothetical protein
VRVEIDVDALQAVHLLGAYRDAVLALRHAVDDPAISADVIAAPDQTKPVLWTARDRYNRSVITGSLLSQRTAPR